MKMPRHLNATGASHRKAATARPLRDQSGSAVVIVLVLAFIMCMLISDNGLVLHHLKQELQLVEKKQLQHHETRLNRIRLRSTRHPTEMLPALAGTKANEKP